MKPLSLSVSIVIQYFLRLCGTFSIELLAQLVIPPRETCTRGRWRSGAAKGRCTAGETPRRRKAWIAKASKRVS